MREWDVTDSDRFGHTVEADTFEVEGEYLVFYKKVSIGFIKVAAFYRAIVEEK